MNVKIIVKTILLFVTGILPTKKKCGKKFKFFRPRRTIRGMESA